MPWLLGMAVLSGSVGWVAARPAGPRPAKRELEATKTRGTAPAEAARASRHLAQVQLVRYEAAEAAPASGGFKPVCCKRADGTPYWSTGQWCDDLGAAVDDSFCDAQARIVCCELPAAGPTGQARMAQLTERACRSSQGVARDDDMCDSSKEKVCCQHNGHASETTRGQCRAARGAREVEASQCEQVCCQPAESQTASWSSRASCGGPRSRGAKVVDGERCDEICCELIDRTTRREGRRTCVARGGQIRAAEYCGAVVEMETTESVEPEEAAPARGGDNPFDVLDRPPPASPYQ